MKFPGKCEEVLISLALDIGVTSSNLRVLGKGKDNPDWRAIVTYKRLVLPRIFGNGKGRKPKRSFILATYCYGNNVELP